MATTESENELAECLSTPLRPLNDIDDDVATTSADCNYENYEEFAGSVEMDFFEKDFTAFFKDLLKKTEAILISKDKCDVRNVFEESGISTMKFNLFIWHFLENGKRSDSSRDAVEDGVLAASCYISMCSLAGSRTDLYQSGLYNQCLKIARNCCHTVRIGEQVGGRKKKNETTMAAPDPSEPLIGPPRISVDSAERYLHHLTTQLFGFLMGNGFSLDPATQMSTMELIEDIGRLDLDNKARAYRANSIREFRTLDRFTDRYCALVHCLIESKYPTRREMAFGRLIRPRLALLPFPDESTKTSKISTERKRAGELTVSLILSRIARGPAPIELKLIETCLIQIYVQCPDFAEFRANIAQFVMKILEAMPYGYAYDFVQLMHVMFKGKGNGGVKSVSNEIASLLLFGFDFGRDDPGAVEEVREEREEEDSEDPEEEDPEEEEEKKKKPPKKAPTEQIHRLNATSILYNIIYLACIDKSAPMRLHGAHSLSKILGDPNHRKSFQEFCEKSNEQIEEEPDLEDSMESDAPLDKTTRKKPTDILKNDQLILDKWNRLKQMNRGEERVEKDIIYMIVRRLATDEKAPVKKAACPLVTSFLAGCDEQCKFETVLAILQKLCRDRMVSVRKTAAEAFTDLMLMEEIGFKQILSSKWLHSLISMLNDTDNDVTEHARKSIMRVLTPLLEQPSDLTWTLLNTIESVTNHRNYLMTTLKDAVRERLVHKPVMESMKRHIREETDQKTNGAWMVLSQLSVQFEANVEFAMEAFNGVDLTMPSDLMKYMIHIIENNIKKIERETKREMIHMLKTAFQDATIHASHAKCLYHCLGKLMDGIGEEARRSKEFQEFGEELIVKCFDTIVQSFEMFKEKEEWKRNSEAQERLLCVELNVASEVFSYSPMLIERHERLAKTLSLIVNSQDLEVEEVNPEMPSATRPPTQMSDGSHEGMMFSERVRAVCVITLSNMILQHEVLKKLMPTLIRQLKINPCHQIRSNIVISIGDISRAVKTDRYAPMLAASLCDPSVVVRRHAINEIARLISLGVFRFNGEIMIRMMLATLDANEDVRNDAKLYISEVLQSEDPNFFPTNFVQYMIALTQARRLIGNTHDEEDKGQVDVAIGGGDPLARPSRIAIYTFMIESLTDRHRFDVKVSICERVFIPIMNGEYDFREENTQCLLDDALLIMGSSEMQVKMETGKDPNGDNALDEPPVDIVEAAEGFMQTVYLKNYMNLIVPAILKLRQFLNQHRSPLQRKCLMAIRMICLEHSKDIDEILQDNRQLKDEMMFELNRVKQRSEEAHRILNEAMRKVSEFNKQQQKRISIDPTGEEVAPKTPEKGMRSRTEVSTPQSRLLSPKTLKKIRRSVGALIQNDMCLNVPDMGETKGEKTLVEEVERMELEEAPKEDPEGMEEEAEEEEEEKRRSRRRKTPNYSDENESIDADGQVWKKPKIVLKSPEKDVSNVTLRRSRRGSSRATEASEVNDKKKQRKRKASRGEEDEESEPTTSENVENLFDESRIGGRQCSTPIRGRSTEPGDVTFSLNLSAITEREELKNRRTQAYFLQNIFEDDEEEEEGGEKAN